MDNFTTMETFLTGETGVHSNDLMCSTRSLNGENIEECAPTGVHDRFGEMMVFHHIGDDKIFYNNTLISLSIGLGRFEIRQRGSMAK